MKNQYEIATEMIINSNYEIKGLKTFMGREGYGVNASLYYKGKKIAFIMDSGNGGCLDIDYLDGHHRNTPSHITEFLKTLPSFTNKERGFEFREDEESRMNEEDFCNELIDYSLAQKEFKKCLKKVSVLTDDNTIASYKAKSSELDNTYNFKEGKMTFREYVLKDKSVKTILNDLPLDDAFNVYMENRGGA